MRKYIFIIISMLMVLSANAQKLNASLGYARFYNPELGPYVETYLSVETAGVKLVPVEKGKYQAMVNLLLIFKSHDSIIDYSKTQLKSPLLDDTLHLNFNFIDQQRFVLPNGKYTLEIEFADANREHSASQAKVDVDLGFDDQSIQISDVELLASYEKSKETKINTKNGFDMVPHVSNFYAQNEDKLTYYAEIYHADTMLGAHEKFLIIAYISNANDDQLVNDLVVRRRMEAKKVNVILNQFNIAALASGNYYLHIEIRDRQNRLMVANKSFFQVSNPSVPFDKELLAEIDAGATFVDKFSSDSLSLLIESAYPIATPVERSFIKNSLQTATDVEKKKFLLFFWKSRNSHRPELAWEKYQLEVIKTNKSFGNKFTPGFATDRGRVYLQYGPPNTISDQEFESGGGRHNGSVPYQIWHYYEIGNQRNGKFVFYNPHLIPNGYELLHSNVVGEINNPHWQTYLHRNQLEDIDAPDNDRYNGRSGELYNNPR